MRTSEYKYNIKIAVYSSIIISVIGAINTIVDPRNSYNTYSFILLRIFAVCIVNWSLLILTTYLTENISAIKKRIKAVTIFTYYLIGIPATHFTIYLTNHVVQNQIYANSTAYRKLFLSFLLCSTILLTKYTFNLLSEKQKIDIENERLLRENLQVRFEILRQQINPHFLFNSLATLKVMLRDDKENAETFIMRLSDMLRYSLKLSSSEKVPLGEELTILEAYLFMLKCRFENKLVVHIDINPKYHSYYIPPFSLQTIVENCVKHNIISAEHPLEIKIHSTEDYQLIISNTLQPKKAFEPSTCIGLANIDKRYQYLCNQHIKIDRDDKYYTVTIPIIPNI